jgi:hypothetical protein
MKTHRNLSQNQWGAILRVPVVENGRAKNLASYVELSIYIKKPGGTVLTKTAGAGEVSLTTDGSDGLFQYSTIVGDLSEPGSYEWQGEVELPSGKFRSPRGGFYVEKNIA